MGAVLIGDLVGWCTRPQWAICGTQQLAANMCTKYGFMHIMYQQSSALQRHVNWSFYGYHL